MNKYLVFLILLSHSFVMAQQNFSILYDFEPTTVRGLEIQLHNGHLYLIVGKLCYDPLRECGDVIKVDLEGNIIWVKELGAFDIGNSNRLFIVNDTISVTGHRNLAEQSKAFFMEQLSLNGDSLTSFVWPFAQVELESAPINYGTLRLLNHWYLYGAGLQDDGQVDAIILKTNTLGQIVSKTIWDDGYEEYQLGDLQENKNGSIVGTAKLEVQNDQSHRRAIILFDKNLNRSVIWDSELMLDFSILNNFLVLKDNSFLIVTPNIDSWKASVSPMLIKVSETGEELWRFEFNHVFGIDIQRNISNIKEASNGDILGVGFYQPAEGIQSAWMFRISANGSLVWETNFKSFDWVNGGDQVSNDLNDLVELEDGCIIGLGWQEESSLPDPPDDAWLVKVGPDGCLIENNCDFNQFTTSVKDVIERTINVFPNPTQSVLNLDLQGNINISQIELLNLQGNLIPTINSISSQINVSSLTPGTYFLKIITESGKVRLQKFIKI